MFRGRNCTASTGISSNYQRFQYDSKETTRKVQVFKEEFSKSFLERLESTSNVGCGKVATEVTYSPMGKLVQDALFKVLSSAGGAIPVVGPFAADLLTIIPLKLYEHYHKKQTVKKAAEISNELVRVGEQAISKILEETSHELVRMFEQQIALLKTTTDVKKLAMHAVHRVFEVAEKLSEGDSGADSVSLKVESLIAALAGGNSNDSQSSTKSRRFFRRVASGKAEVHLDRIIGGGVRWEASEVFCISEADFSECDLSHIQVTRKNFKSSNFNDCRLVGSQWEDVDLQGSSLMRADLRWSVLSNVDLRGDTNLVQTNLNYALLAAGTQLTDNLSFGSAITERAHILTYKVCFTIHESIATLKVSTEVLTGIEIPSMNSFQRWSFSSLMFMIARLLTLLILPTLLVGQSTIPTAAPSSVRSSINAIYTIAGTGAASSTGTGDFATAMTLNSPIGIFQDSAGVTYLVESSGNCVRSFLYPNGIVTNVAGVCGSTASYSGDSGRATSAGLNNPFPVVVDTQGTVYIGDLGDGHIRSISSGTITSLAGSGTNTANNIPVSSASLGSPRGLWIDSLGQLYVATDGGCSAKRIAAGGSRIISLVAGTGTASTSGDGGQATSATMAYPFDIFCDTNGIVYVGETGGGRVRQVSTSGTIKTVLGSVNGAYNGDNQAGTSTTISYPIGIVVDTSNGDIYVCGNLNYRILVLTKTTGLVTTYAGSGTSTASGDGGAATSAGLTAQYVFLDTTGRMFTTDTGNNRGRVIYSVAPTVCPTVIPTISPTVQLTMHPTTLPTQPSSRPTSQPSLQPSSKPSLQPFSRPSKQPTSRPSLQPSSKPSHQPSSKPSLQPFSRPTKQPTSRPSLQPSSKPSSQPSVQPSRQPFSGPTSQPTFRPTSQPYGRPSFEPTRKPSIQPTGQPCALPSSKPTIQPTSQPTERPTSRPSQQPSVYPTNQPSMQPTTQPSIYPTKQPSNYPSAQPIDLPSIQPSRFPTSLPSDFPSTQPSSNPTKHPSLQPQGLPSGIPTTHPSHQPSCYPSLQPTGIPTNQPNSQPTSQPIDLPSSQPSESPTIQPSQKPISQPSETPSIHPLSQPSSQPSVLPSSKPSGSPSNQPTGRPSHQPVMRPSSQPSVQPSFEPSFEHRVELTVSPSCQPIRPPTSIPTENSFSLIHATLPGAMLSVIGSIDFQIVLPFMQVIPEKSGTAFKDIFIPLSGTFGTYVVLGSYSSPYSVSVTDGSRVHSYSNAVSSDQIRRSASVLKDINGDGYIDIIIGDPYVAKCYVLFGLSHGLTNMTKGFTIFGEQSTDLTGWSVSGTSDFNNDTLADIIVGAPNANGVGAFYVIYGRNTQISYDVYLNNLNASEGFAVYGAVKGDYLGLSVSGAGDVNKDGFDDVIAGAALTISLNAGAAYIMYGGRDVQSMVSIAHLSSSQGCKLSGVSYMFAGYSVSGAGDFNKDGYDDVIIGTSPVRSSLPLASYILFGSATLSNTMLSTLTAAQGVHIVGGGTIVSYVGDVNHDGYADVLIGTNIANNGLNGLIVCTNISHLTADTVKPTLAPTIISLVPSVKPSRQPSVKPSLKSSVMPTTIAPSIKPSSRVPTMINATDVPSISLTIVPTNEPSTLSSECPSIRPSVEPSEQPTMKPSIEPSENPTCIPSVRSTIAPSTFQPTDAVIYRLPYSVPTISPTVQVVLPPVVDYLIGGHSTVYDDSTSTHNTRYVVNATGEVEIDPSHGLCTYYIVPSSNDLTLTIERFNVSSVIDLSLFTNIHQYSDLSITEGSVIITLSTTQMIHIMDQEPAAISERNFIFGPPLDNKPNKISTATLYAVVTIASISVVVGMIIFLHWLYGQARKRVTGALTDRAFIGNFHTDKNGEYIFDADDEDSEVSVNLSDHTIDSNREALADRAFIGNYHTDKNGEYIFDADDEDSEASVNLSDHTIDSNGEWKARYFEAPVTEHPFLCEAVGQNGYENHCYPDMECQNTDLSCQGYSFPYIDSQFLLEANNYDDHYANGIVNGHDDSLLEYNNKEYSQWETNEYSGWETNEYHRWATNDIEVNIGKDHNESYEAYEYVYKDNEDR